MFSELKKKRKKKGLRDCFSDCFVLIFHGECYATHAFRWQKGSTDHQSSHLKPITYLVIPVTSVFVYLHAKTFRDLWCKKCFHSTWTNTGNQCQCPPALVQCAPEVELCTEVARPTQTLVLEVSVHVHGVFPALILPQGLEMQKVRQPQLGHGLRNPLLLWLGSTFWF